jgi:subtilisin family serine protease
MPMKPFSTIRRALAVLAAACLPALVSAQLRLPSLPSLPNAPALPSPSETLGQVRREVLPPVAELVRARQQRMVELLRRRADLVEADPAGEPVLRNELLLNSPSDALLATARAEGFTQTRERVLGALEMRVVTLRPPAGWDTARALRRLRELDPQVSADFNHLYLESGETAPLRTPPAAPPGAGSGAPNGLKLGLIDAGVDASHPAFRDTSVQTWGCAGKPVASAHGTSVASLLVGRAGRFRGAAPGARLYAADVYCGEPTGGSVEAVALALAWLLGERVGVVNISLVGPSNQLLELAVRRASAKGMLLVAAVGNDGPAAPPLYPSAYPDVVGVTGVDPSGQVLPEAGRGPHVAFAAPGADMAAAGFAPGSYTRARGTSFAAPLVAGLLAASLREPDPAAASMAVAALARGAADRGAPGRDPVYGHGLVARELRTDPSALAAR